MPDIAKCANNKCKLRFKCYRFQAKASPWQSYSDFKPTDNCYMEIKNDRKRKLESCKKF